MIEPVAVSNRVANLPWLGLTHSFYKGIGPLPDRQNNFDGIRLIAAIAVACSHQYWVARHEQPHLLGTMSLGTFAVLIFFSISGFLVASSWDNDPSFWRFGIRRILRIWPAYAVVVVSTSTLLAWFVKGEFMPLAAWIYMRQNLIFNNFDWAFFPSLADPRINAPLWTIPYEVACYVVFAVGATLLRRFWCLVIATLALPGYVWWTWGLSAFDPSGRPPMEAFALFSAFFLSGILLYDWRLLDSKKASSIVLLLGIFALISGWSMIGVILVLPLCSIFVGSRSWPGMRAASKYGDLSFGLYLWAWPIQQFWLLLLGEQTSVIALLALTLTGALCTAFLSWHFVEKYALRLKPKALERR